MESHVPRAQPERDDETGPIRAVLGAARPLRRRGLAQEVADQLVDLIASSSSSEVALPPERALRDQFAVSRNVLREALAALDQMGLVETRGKTRVGLTPRARAQQLARLAPPTSSSTRELMLDPLEVRRIIEPETAALAAERISPAAVEQLAHWETQLEEAAARGEGVMEYDAGFHVAIARATGNQMLIDLVGAVADALRRSRELSFRPSDAEERAIADHQRILDAIRAGDSERARRAMRAHLDHVEDLIRASIAQRSD
jgi:GntR family transcriptional repressor for pyruvate dehydrogenase complex